MARILPQHFKRDGQPKRCYESREKALAAKAPKESVYRCDFCGCWHRASR